MSQEQGPALCSHTTSTPRNTVCACPDQLHNGSGSFTQCLIHILAVSDAVLSKLVSGGIDVRSVVSPFLSLRQQHGPHALRGQ